MEGLLSDNIFLACTFDFNVLRALTDTMSSFDDFMSFTEGSYRDSKQVDQLCFLISIYFDYYHTVMNITMTDVEIKYLLTDTDNISCY